MPWSQQENFFRVDSVMKCRGINEEKAEEVSGGRYLPVYMVPFL